MTGAAGTIGKRAFSHLRSLGRDVRAIVHKEADASAELRSLGAEMVVDDHVDSHSIQPAFKDVGSAHFCYPLAPSAVEAVVLFGDAAVEAKVSAIVNISQICTRRESKSRAALNHRVEGQLLERTGIPTTHLRLTFFAE